MEVINFTNNHILARVVEDVGFAWMLTCFYGWSEASQKPKSWALLNHIRSFVDGPLTLYYTPQRNKVSTLLLINRWMIFEKGPHLH